MDLSELHDKVQRLQGKKEALRESIRKTKQDIKDFSVSLQRAEKVRAILQIVAKQTQEQLEFRISELSTLALKAVMETDSAVVLKFSERRGKTEADIFLDREGNQVPPVYGGGGGVADLVSLTLRFSLWSLMRPQSRKTMILDEPLKWLKGRDLPEKGAEILSSISSRLGLQIISVSHSPEIVAGADAIIDLSPRTIKKFNRTK